VVVLNSNVVPACLPNTGCFQCITQSRGLDTQGHLRRGPLPQYCVCAGRSQELTHTLFIKQHARSRQAPLAKIDRSPGRQNTITFTHFSALYPPCFRALSVAAIKFSCFYRDRAPRFLCGEKQLRGRQTRPF
jgi:hypothetical protein